MLTVDLMFHCRLSLVTGHRSLVYLAHIQPGGHTSPESNQTQRKRELTPNDRQHPRCCCFRISYSRATVLRRPWVQGVWANALTPLRLDQAVVERAANPAGHGAGVASSV